MEGASDADRAALDHLHRDVLEPGERVVWKGRPDPRAAATAGAVVGPAVIGLPLLLFMGQVTLGAAGAAPQLAVFALPFALAGGWLVARPLLFLRAARRAYYAITDRRVVVLVGARRFSSTSRSGGLAGIDRKPDRRDAGTIRLAREETLAADGFPLARFSDALWGIADLDRAAGALADIGGRRLLARRAGH